MVKLKSLLFGFNRMEGIEGCAVVTKDGFVIEHTLPSDIDLDALGAMVVTLYGALERLGQELKLNNLEFEIAEYKGSMLLIEDLGEALFAVLAKKNALLGKVRYEMKKRRDELKAAL